VAGLNIVDLKYTTACNMAIFPTNSDQDVERAAKIFDVENLDQQIVLKAKI
jgi:hypothetical protein